MKNIFITIMITLFSMSAVALENVKTKTTKTVEESSIEVFTEVPEHLKGSKACILKEGLGYQCVPSEEYMIVKRKHKRPIIKEVVTKEVSGEMPVAAEKANPHKNIVSLKVVDGYSDVKKEESGKTLTLKVERQVGAGIQYQRAITDKVYVGGELDSNRGVGVLLGVGF